MMQFLQDKYIYKLIYKLIIIYRMQIFQLKNRFIFSSYKNT